ncbi:class I SAM-dependent DNA methyltransferase [Protaetiibacter intestinalis]|uniref:site-specific DNA-methyltransferase (adenine-specific) n=1 Tax=Protaetiibacter intestinalis TaxID=2419774 RepID=A0A387BEL5_9MICO|nr:DNA methyltransferase [Protaetiibacter intestinalis]AYF96920.1 class I SAM-dependent DNA methyltransferase [Protaetiibacter intestinalis]
MGLNLKSVEERVRPLGGRTSYDREFIFELMAAYGRSSSNITRLRNGSLNVAVEPSTEVAQKNVIYFKETTDDLLAVIDELRSAPTVVRYNTRFVVVTDYEELLAVDTKTNDSLAIPISDIDKHFTFFLPWAGMEKAQYVAEAHADVKAAERMAKLFDELLALNPKLNTTTLGRHALNVFFARLLFCFFAEDTGIFEEGQFTEAVGTLTQPDGSDVSQFLTDLFTALDTADPADKPTHLAGFPYVNGRLFTVEEHHTVPAFNKKARDLLLESGRLLWNEINPDIFGSMFQAVVTPGQRSDLGQHYTSVPNILKTIEPLFLDGLKEQFDVAFDSASKLEALLRRIAQIKVFDPACGSGNFLVIAYKELRKLEHVILERLAQIDTRHQTLYAESKINIENFYGLELDDFAVEIAILSLWIAKHQMNREFFEKFRLNIPLIPLKETGQVKQGNATRTDWNTVCPNNGDEEIYLIGNPPYVGTRDQTSEQKADYVPVFGRRPFSKNLDYISLWFVKGAEYISGSRAELAFVTTNSVSRGEHVGLLFPMLFSIGVEIGFAYTGFRWENNAKRNAGVTVAVISLRSVRPGSKCIYTDGLRVEAENINGYLADGEDIYISRRSRPLRGAMPEMYFGNMALDGGGLILSSAERAQLERSDPDALRFVRRLYGSKEYIHDLERFCLWITAPEVDEALRHSFIADRVERTGEFRASRSDVGTRKKAATPWSFREQRSSRRASILVPKTSSERRDYVPVGFVDSSDVVSDLAFAIFDPELWVFSVITSRMHMTWVKAVAGRKDNRLRYSNLIVYNNFPVPPLSVPAKEQLTEAALRVLDVREYHSEKTLAELYDPDLMPDDLRLAHQELDELVDAVYRKRGFDSDEERLSYLFGMYEQMTAGEKRK